MDAVGERWRIRGGIDVRQAGLVAGASAGRGLHLSSDGVTVYDRGVMQRVLPADPSSAYLALSGPYWAQYALDPTTLSWTTTAFDVTGTQKATSSQESLLFGSRFVTITTDTDPVAGSIHLTVTDLTGVAAPANFTSRRALRTAPSLACGAKRWR